MHHTMFVRAPSLWEGVGEWAFNFINKCKSDRFFIHFCKRLVKLSHQSADDLKPNS